MHKKLHLTININAPKEKVWDVVTSDNTYKQWIVAFGAEGRFEGNWEKGTKMRFMGKSEDGTEMGMVSIVEENKLYEFISLNHIGFYKDGKEDMESDEVKKWVPMHENYTFNEENGVTTFILDMDIPESEFDMFTEMWPKGLAKIKELSEK